MNGKILKIVDFSIVDTNFSVIKRFDHKTSRVLIHPIGDYSCRAIEQLTQELTKELLPKIHPHIFGYPSNRGPAQSLIFIIERRLRGCYTVRFDLHKAFMSVNISRLRSLLKQAKIPSNTISKLNALGCLCSSSFMKIHFRGLPQGFATSPILFCFYITKLIERIELTSQSEVMFFADDGFAFTHSKSSAEKLISQIAHCLVKHSGPDGRMRLSQKPHKKPRIFSPHDPLPVLGITINTSTDQLIMPSATTSASYYASLIKTIRSLSTMKGVSLPTTLKQFINNLLPTTTRNTSDNIQQRYNLNQHRLDSHPMDDQPTHMETHTRRIIFEQMLDNDFTQDYRWELRFTGLAHAHSASDFPYGTSYSPSQIHQRQLVLISTIDQCSHRLNKIFAKISLNPNNDESLAMFLVFICELWHSFIFFHPFEMLTVSFHDKLRLLPREYEYARYLYFNELRVINRLTLIKPFLTHQEFDFKISWIQCILRGHVHRKWLQLNNKLNVCPTQYNMEFLGKFFWPNHKLSFIASELLDLQKNLTTSRYIDTIKPNELSEVFDSDTSLPLNWFSKTLKTCFMPETAQY